ncbi:hypothetical protein ACVIN2_002944 [Bradyrhizobium sp. USDA 3650]
MIRHIVFFTAKDKAHVDEVIEGLLVLTTIPYARRLEIDRNRKSDQIGNEIDIVVYGEFDSETDLAADKTHRYIRSRSGGSDHSESCGSLPTTTYQWTRALPAWSRKAKLSGAPFHQRGLIC